MDGIQTVIAICEKVPTARLVIFTTCQGEEDIYRALRAGAYGYLLNDTLQSELAVSSGHLVVHTFPESGRRHYGTDTAPERHNDRGDPSSDTAWSREPKDAGSPSVNFSQYHTYSWGHAHATDFF